MSGGPYKETCKCGHDKASHYADPSTGARGACLTFGDCPCKRYAWAWGKAEPAPPTPRNSTPNIFAGLAKPKVTSTGPRPAPRYAYDPFDLDEPPPSTDPWP